MKYKINKKGNTVNFINVKDNKPFDYLEFADKLYDGEKIEVKRIKVKEPLHYVFADLGSKKDTIKILADLNRSYPYPISDIDLSVHKGLGEKNKEIVLKTIKYIEEGDLVNLGKTLTKSQSNFDKYVSIACKDELTSPVLHKVLNDN